MKNSPVESSAAPQLRALQDHLNAAQDAASNAARELCRDGDPWAVAGMVAKANQLGAMARWIELHHGIKRG